MPTISQNRFVVLDTETTGATPGKDKPIEIAMVELLDGVVGDPVSYFIDPEMRIPPEASAIHHLIDSDIEGAPTLEQLWPVIQSFIQDSVIVAHNANFDIAMLPQLQTPPSICTLNFARHLWERGSVSELGFPLASHQQQVLRYWLGLQVDTKGLAAHRAAADILVTASLFLKETQYYLDCGGEDDLTALNEFLARPIEITRMPFGKYAGELLSSIKEDYLQYIFDQKTKPLDPDLRSSIKRELDLRKAQIIISNRI